MFRFRLASVLDHRARLVEAEARELHRREAELQSVRRRRRERRRLTEDAARRAGSGPLEIEQRRRLAVWLDRQRELDVVDATSERELDSRAEAQRLRLLEAQRGKSVLEKLRERQLRQWEDGERRREQKELDEIGARRRHVAAVRQAASDRKAIQTGSGTS